MITIERILCPTDLSPQSDGALHYGIALARAYEAKLFVCHCPEALLLADQAGRGEIERLFRGEIASHVGRAAQAPPGWEGSVLWGEPATAIVAEAKRRRADLIVMQSRRRPHAAALLGSTAEAVCHTAPCPVLVTHPREREWVGAATGEVGIARLLVAHDFSACSEAALSYGLALAEEYQGELHLLHVLPPDAGPDAPQNEWLRSSAEDRSQQARRRLRSAIPKEAYLWCEVEPVVREGSPSREVLAYAAEYGIDLICLGVRGASYGLRTFYGSTVDQVLRRSPCPVLVARPLPARAGESRQARAGVSG